MGLDEKVARRQGLPFKIPVPDGEFESLADSGLKAEELEVWIKDFLATAPVAKDGNWRRRNSSLVSQLEGYLDKKPLWDKAQRLFQDNDFEKALKTLKRITIMMPDDHAARMNYANALANQGEFDKAFKQLRQVRETFEGDPDFHVTVAQIHVARGDEDAAIAELATALEAQPGHRPAMVALEKLGVVTSIYEDPRDAASLVYVRADSVLDYLKQQWDSEPRNTRYYVEQLGYHDSAGRYEVALEAADRALAVDGGCVQAALGRIHALRQLARDGEALAAAQTLVQTQGDLAAAQLELSKCHAKVGNEGEATLALDVALAKDPGDQEALVYKLWPKDTADIQAVQAAMGGIQAWADDHAEVSGAWRSLARAKLVVGDDEAALTLFARAVELAPEDDDLRSEWWGELARALKYDDIIADANALENMPERDWKLRWNEAEAYHGKDRKMEARACYMQINTDESLHVDIRKRAKRAALRMGAAPAARSMDASGDTGDE